MANNNKRPVAKGNINKKKLPRWLVVTIVVAVVLLAIAAIAAAPFLSATADKEASLFIKRGTSNDAVEEMIAAEVSSDFSSKVMELPAVVVPSWASMKTPEGLSVPVPTRKASSSLVPIRLANSDAI